MAQSNMPKIAKAKLINTISYTNICNPTSTARVQKIQLRPQRLQILNSADVGAKIP